MRSVRLSSATPVLMEIPAGNPAACGSSVCTAAASVRAIRLAACGCARGQQQQELVPAPPSDDVAAAHDGHGNPGDFAEGGIARVVTVGVVVALEVVEVEEHDGQRFTAARGRIDGIRGHGLECLPVVRAGHMVTGGCPDQRLVVPVDDDDGKGHDRQAGHGAERQAEPEGAQISR